ncbi:hypothetical protein Nepgr_005923 [Nepenthes gracilis]|uniref:DUF4408 domain-containing protein n=1 Tax=Nepenthes gracilis TaxID=150966 RepID=A0AAD3S426_NEPGR|nr:hypothetical protein Nepgr_005923 [Nepenthes gracilis]
MVVIGAFMASWFSTTNLFVLLNVTVATIVVISSFGTRKQRHERQPLGERSPPLARAPSLFSRVTSFNFSHFHRSVERGPFPHSSAGVETPDDEKPPPLARAPSLLSRVCSFNFSHFHRNDEQGPFPHSTAGVETPGDEKRPQLDRAPSLLSRVASFNFSFYRSTQHDPSPPSAATLRDTMTLNENESPGRDEGGGGERERDTHAWSCDRHVTRTKSEPEQRPAEASDKTKMMKSASEKSVRQSSEGTWTVSLGHDPDVDVKADDFISKFKQQLKLERLESLIRRRTAAEQ